MGGKFVKGYINGSGTVWLDMRNDREETTIIRDWSYWGGRTFREIVQYMHDSKLEVKAAKDQENEEIYGVNIALSLHDYVEEVRADIYDERQALILKEEEAKNAYRKERLAERKAMIMAAIDGRPPSP